MGKRTSADAIREVWRTLADGNLTFTASAADARLPGFQEDLDTVIQCLQNWDRYGAMIENNDGSISVILKPEPRTSEPPTPTIGKTT